MGHLAILRDVPESPVAHSAFSKIVQSDSIDQETDESVYVLRDGME